MKKAKIFFLKSQYFTPKLPILKSGCGVSVGHSRHLAIICIRFAVLRPTIYPTIDQYFFDPSSESDTSLSHVEHLWPRRMWGCPLPDVTTRFQRSLFLNSQGLQNYIYLSLRTLVFGDSFCWSCTFILPLTATSVLGYYQFHLGPTISSTEGIFTFTNFVMCIMLVIALGSIIHQFSRFLLGIANSIWPKPSAEPRNHHLTNFTIVEDYGNRCFTMVVTWNELTHNEITIWRPWLIRKVTAGIWW